MLYERDGDEGKQRPESCDSETASHNPAPVARPCESSQASSTRGNTWTWNWDLGLLPEPLNLRRGAFSCVSSVSTGSALLSSPTDTTAGLPFRLSSTVLCLAVLDYCPRLLLAHPIIPSSHPIRSRRSLVAAAGPADDVRSQRARRPPSVLPPPVQRVVPSWLERGLLHLPADYPRLTVLLPPAGPPLRPRWPRGGRRMPQRIVPGTLLLGSWERRGVAWPLARRLGAAARDRSKAARIPDRAVNSLGRADRNANDAKGARVSTFPTPLAAQRPFGPRAPSQEPARKHSVQ